MSRGEHQPAGSHQSSTNALEALLRHPALWRTSDSASGLHTLPTGFMALDALLPGGGWPLGALTEIVVERQGLGELAITLPALADLCLQGRSVAWVAPPYVPYAPALQAAGIDLAQVLWLRSTSLDDRLWAAEQALRSGVCGAVLLWLTPEHATGMTPHALRRLQLAAEQGQSLAFLFWRRAIDSSPAMLRLRVGASTNTAGANANGTRAAGQARARVRVRESARAFAGAGSAGERPAEDSRILAWPRSKIAEPRSLSLEILKCRGPGTNKMVTVPLDQPEHR